MMTVETLMSLTPETTLSVYNGRAGKCACGCAGKHSYNSRKVVEGGEGRGYPVSPTEVDDRRVARILKKVQDAVKNPNLWDDLSFGSDYVALERGTRQYIVSI